MLQIMKEYPDFKFSQSQASVYRILERFAPEMLEEVKERVTEGRWELTASAWVETDKNMANGESLSRHILYAKNYLSKLFSVDPDSLEVDFDPDTFGHSRNVPEISSEGGVILLPLPRPRWGADFKPLAGLLRRGADPVHGTVLVQRGNRLHRGGICRKAGGADRLQNPFKGLRRRRPRRRPHPPGFGLPY